MEITVNKTTLEYNAQTLNALMFLPSEPKPLIAAFTHGYTSHKGSILNWSVRLAEEGVASIIFDLPGHYLGTFSEVDSVQGFEENAPALFVSAVKELQAKLGGGAPDKIILGGHSLGALISMLSLDNEYWVDKDTVNICVGFGFPPSGVTHVFQTPFYKSTLNLRAQLVSPGLNPDETLPWINEAKRHLSLTDRRVHLITGKDDIIVGEDGSEQLRDHLLSLGNQVSLDRPNKLSHHLPENAASIIKQFVKKELL
jgi:predicted esterase